MEKLLNDLDFKAIKTCLEVGIIETDDEFLENMFTATLYKVDILDKERRSNRK